MLTLSTYFCSALSQVGQEHGLRGSSSRPARSFDSKSWIKLEYSLEPYQPKSPSPIIHIIIPNNIWTNYNINIPTNQDSIHGEHFFWSWKKNPSIYWDIFHDIDHYRSIVYSFSIGCTPKKMTICTAGAKSWWFGDDMSTLGNRPTWAGKRRCGVLKR